MTRNAYRLLSLLPAFLLAPLAPLPCAGQTAYSAATNANRLVYLDDADPFYVHRHFPRLTTPQWVGEEGVEAVVTLAIDDMREAQRYENYLRPILERLKQIDGRAPVSIMVNSIDPQNPLLQTWLEEGLSLEIHTLAHPCPLLAKGNFAAAADTYHGCVDLMNAIPGNKPVAFRMPCCDSMNSPSPRFFAEIFNRTNSSGQFLTISSSVMNITTPHDPALPRELTVDPDGREKFRKYLPFPSFVTTIEDYPYPYVIGRLGWEFPGTIPSDWEAQNILGVNNAKTVEDWKTALDITVLKQGTFNLIFHPYNWIKPEQVIELIDHAVSKHGRKVKFLNFREANDRLAKHLLDGQGLRAKDGSDNGARLIDLNNDGCLDVILARGEPRLTRIWNPTNRTWKETAFPVALIESQDGAVRETGARFGILRDDGKASFFIRNERVAGFWHFDGNEWIEDSPMLAGLELDGEPVFTSRAGRDRGVRFRDVNKNGRCELIVGNETQNAVFSWEPAGKKWTRLGFSLPRGTMIVDAEGRDAGLRFVDIDQDGFDDVIFSNAGRYSLHLFVPKPKPHLGWYYGWSQIIREGNRGDAGAIPMIVRGGERNHNGAWFHSGHLWVQNEDTADLPDHVDRRSYAQLLAFDSPPPIEAKEALATFQPLPGFKIELVTHEPQVMDPIAFEWGPDGKLWVVEMGDYPVGVDGRGKSGGVIRALEDRDGDGFYETSTVFLDGLNFPTGVMPWRNGILVSAAPEIFYAEDSTGDGKADLRKVLFTGFREGNQQHRVNGFEYGIDNWVYGANGDSGGVIRSIQTGRSVNISGRDFRFNPDTGEFETQAGQTQFGRRRDDWGNWFGNNNPNWGWHYWLPEHYLSRNPHLAVRSSRQMLGNYPNATRIFPISKPMQRFNWPDLGNTLTSANSPTPYRDELFGPEFNNSLFVSEPEYNLVHREVLSRQGVTFTSRRADNETNREFLASTDNWFRPCMTKTGPNGALYVADMYRLVIEHIEYGFPEMAERIDLRAGADRGRIYRVYPEGAKLRPFPRLDRMSTAERVAALETPNGWQRDTVQRLLVHAQDKAAVPPLKELLQRSPNAKTRLHALGALDGLGAISPELLVLALRDSHPAVREHGVRLSEPFLKNPASPESLAAFHDVLLQLANDREERVRFQLAFTLGEWSDPRAAIALARLAGRDFKDTHLQTAIMSSAPAHLQRMLTVVMTDFSEQRGPAELLQALLVLAADLGDQASLAEGLSRLGERASDDFDDWQFATFAGVLDALDRRNSNLASLQSGARTDLRQALAKLDPMFRQAREDVDAFLKAPSSDGAARLPGAIRILGRGVSESKTDLERLGHLLRPQIPGEVQEAALNALSRLRGAAVGEALLAGWRSYPPALRSKVLGILLSRQEWMAQLLSAVAMGDIQRGQIAAADQQTMLNHAQPAIRDQARQLLSTVAQDRQKIVQQYERVGSLTGNAAAGAALFKEHCASCHRLKGQGVAVGPDLAMMSDKSVQAFVAGTFDPNQSIDPAFLSYTAVTSDERELSGIITSETPTSITLKMADGGEEVLLRRDLAELTSSGLSLMPEGLEAAIAPQGMADLIAYILSP